MLLRRGRISVHFKNQENKRWPERVEGVQEEPVRVKSREQYRNFFHRGEVSLFQDRSGQTGPRLEAFNGAMGKLLYFSSWGPDRWVLRGCGGKGTLSKSEK